MSKLLDNLIKLVNHQAEDFELWHGNDIAYVRKKLRLIHATIEDDPLINFFKNQ